MRVLLHKTALTHDVQWTFESPHGFYLRSVRIKTCKKRIKNKKITIRLKHGIIYCDGKKVRDGVIIEPLAKYAACNGVEYDGNFCVVQENNALLCINHVDLERYIVAVLRTESWPGWPLEVNKVFAIACRSYVAYKMNEAKKSGCLYHVKNSNAHQTYKGRHDVRVLQQAVEQTRGIILGFDKKPLLAMFDSCCGGIIPAHIADFDFRKAPYLARTYPCTYCKQCSLYSWKIIYEQSELEKILTSHNKKINRLQDIYVVQKDRAGLVEQVGIKAPREYILMTGKDIYSFLKEVKSFSFSIHKNGELIIFFGNGFGHHIGLCQWGARQMVREGWDYRSILQFYYPGTHFMQLARVLL